MTPFEEVEALAGLAESHSEFRTVISRAYYVSFRRLVEITTPLGFFQDIPPVSRGEKHASVHRRLFDFMRTANLPVLRTARHLIEELFKLRVRADYRFATVVNRTTAEEAIRIARDVHDWLDDAGLR